MNGIASSQEGRQRHVPGEPGLWVLILGDMIIFGTFFITFMYYRMQDVASFSASHRHMAIGIGILNTVLLLTSSLFVTRAVDNARSGRIQQARGSLFLAAACGTLFLLLKIFEYHGKFESGVTINTNTFFLLYFIFTGLHAFHVAIGISVLLFLTKAPVRTTVDTSNQIMYLECGAVFWHLIDMLWVVLFALFYVMR